jgi:predicted amidohydrolase
VRVAVCQLNSRDDREINVEVARSLLEQAAAGGADLIEGAGQPIE